MHSIYVILQEALDNQQTLFFLSHICYQNSNSKRKDKTTFQRTEYRVSRALS